MKLLKTVFAVTLFCLSQVAYAQVSNGEGFTPMEGVVIPKEIQITPNSKKALSITVNFEVESKNFIQQLLKNWSSDNVSALVFLENSLADHVDFFGKMTPKKSIIEEKSVAIKRWPIRSYVERPLSLSVACDNSRRICKVTGLLDWKAKNPDKNRTSTGVAQFDYQLDFANGSPKIILESGVVLERKK